MKVMIDDDHTDGLHVVDQFEEAAQEFDRLREWRRESELFR